MRIGQFVSFGVGGADKAAYNLVKGLCELGNDVLVFYNNQSLPLKGYLSRLDSYDFVKIIKIDSVKELNKYGLTILNTHRSGDDRWLLPNFESTRFNFKVVETNHHGFCNTKANIRVFPSNIMAEHRKATEKWVVIPNPILSPQSNDNLRKELNIENKFIFGRIARPDLEIYSDVNLQSYAKIENGNSVFLYVSPNPKAIEDAKKYGIKNIIFVDQVLEEKKISNLYNTFDVLCHSNSLGETFGNTIAEAMIHGKPIISHIGDPCWPQAQPEVIGQMSDILFIKDNIVENYTKLMFKMMNDKEFYSQCSSYCKSRADDLYDYKVVAKKYLELYNRI